MYVFLEYVFQQHFPTLGNQLLRVVRVAGYNNKYLLCENLCLFLEVKYVILSLSLSLTRSTIISLHIININVYHSHKSI